MQEIIAAIRENVRLVDAEFNLNTAQSQLEERQYQVTERTNQEEERNKANESRKLLVDEVQSAETERWLQAEERAKAQVESMRFAQQRQRQANEIQDQTRHNVMKWLSRSETVNVYLNALAKHSENPSSCQWIFDTIEYQTWPTVTDASNALWIHSGPGTGKTVLAGHIVRSLRENQIHPGSAVAFFFCNGTNASKDDPLGVLRTLLCQLLDHLVDHSLNIPQCVLDQYRDSYLKGSESAQSLPFLDIQDLLNQTIDLFQNVHLVVDGIDELTDRVSLLQYLSALGRRGVQDKLRVLVVSRTEPDIRQALGGYRQFSINLSNTRSDVKCFISRSVRARLNLDAIETQRTQKLLLKRARGMFIWVRLVIDLLSDAANAEEFQEILREIPPGLHEIYCLVIENIHKKAATGPSSKKRRVKSILSWLALSFRPLKIQELQEALAIEDSSNGKPSKELSWEQVLDKFRPTEQSIMDVCGNLVDEENGVISLLHHTAREFLLGSRGYRSPDVQQYAIYSNTGNALITKICLIYLINTDSGVQSFFKEDVETLVPEHDLRHNISLTYPFYEYACRQWPFHFGRCPVELNSEPLRSFSTFQLCTSWYQGWALFHPAGRVPYPKLFQRLRKHGRAMCTWLDLMNKMLGGFVAQTDVSLNDIAKYTRDAPSLLKEIPGVSFLNVLDLESASRLGYHSLVLQLVKVQAPDYKVIKPAFNAAIRHKHIETMAVLSEYLTTRDWDVPPIDLAREKGDREIEKILFKRLREKESEIEQFFGSGAKKSKPLVFRMSPAADAEKKKFDRPYWEYDIPASDGVDHLSYRDRGFECFRVNQISTQEEIVEKPRALSYQVTRTKGRTIKLVDPSEILEVVDHEEEPLDLKSLDRRLQSYYLCTASPTWAYSSRLGPSFHLTEPALCRPSKSFPRLRVLASAVRERTWPVKTDMEQFQRIFVRL